MQIWKEHKYQLTLLNISKHINKETQVSGQSSSSSSSDIWVTEFAHPDPRQWPHAAEQSRPFFRHEHFIVLQSVIQLQRMKRKSSSGAGGKSVCFGNKTSSLIFKSHCSRTTLHVKIFHCWIWKNTRWLWYFAAADVGGRVWGLMWFLLEGDFFHKSVCIADYPAFRLGCRCKN